MRNVSATLILALIAGPLRAQDLKQPAASQSSSQPVLCVPEKAQTRVGSPEILGETHGVDLRPYLEASVLPLLRSNWFRLLSKSGEKSGGDATIQFTLLKNGSVAAVKLNDGSGHATLGNLAMNALANASPFPALPAEFGGNSVDLRVPFEFAPVASQFPSGRTGNNLRGMKVPFICTQDQMAKGAVDCLKPPHPVFSPDPEFSAEARKNKSQGTVVLYITVAEDGSVPNACAVQALGDGLEEKAVEAVRTWKFESATFNGKPRAAEIAVQVDFHLYDDPQSASDPAKAPTPSVSAASSSLTPSPGKSIQDSAQAAVHNLPKPSAVEILSDTQGVDFSPYLQNVVSAVRNHWYMLIPADAETKKGRLAIEFAILPDGHVAGMKVVATSGDVSLDRPAWGAIAASNPFPALPTAFTGPHLALRFRFLYNPDASDGTSSTDAGPIVHAVLAKSIEDSGLPKYPRKAIDDKVEGMVRLEAQIAPNGKVESVTPVEGSLLLGEAASTAIRKWTFHPAQKNGKPIEDRVRINVEFRLDGEQVRARVVWPEVLPAASPIAP